MKVSDIEKYTNDFIVKGARRIIVKQYDINLDYDKLNFNFRSKEFEDLEFLVSTDSRILFVIRGKKFREKIIVSYNKYGLTSRILKMEYNSHDIISSTQVIYNKDKRIRSEIETIFYFYETEGIQHSIKNYVDYVYSGEKTEVFGVNNYEGYNYEIIEITNKKGELIESKIVKDDELLNWVKYEYDYENNIKEIYLDSDGNIMQECQIKDNNSDDEKSYFQKHEVEFDEKGNWTKMISKSGDRLGGVTNRIIEYY
jgi:hypothetical protein